MAVSTERVGPPIEEVKEVFWRNRDALLKSDDRILELTTGIRNLREGDYRFVIKARTEDLPPLDRKGLRGQINGIPIAYIYRKPYRPVAQGPDSHS